MFHLWNCQDLIWICCNSCYLPHIFFISKWSWIDLNVFPHLLLAHLWQMLTDGESPAQLTNPHPSQLCNRKANCDEAELQKKTMKTTKTKTKTLHFFLKTLQWKCQTVMKLKRRSTIFDFDLWKSGRTHLWSSEITKCLNIQLISYYGVFVICRALDWKVGMITKADSIWCTTFLMSAAVIV